MSDGALTQYAVPFWLFVTLFLVIPLAVVIAMTIQRRRARERDIRGFEVKTRPPHERQEQPDRPEDR